MICCLGVGLRLLSGTSLALVATGTAFVATTETTVTRHVVRVDNNHHVNRAMVVHRAPLHRHFRHATHRRPLIVVRHS